MQWIAGVDGCPAGWFRVSRETESGRLEFQLLQDATSLLDTEPCPTIMAIDMPIGLPENGPRLCDREARRYLGRPRASSVFPAPLRAALSAESHHEASRIATSINGKGVPVQAWGIYRKVREVDELMRSNQRARGVIREVHPEICFWAWAGRSPMANNKSKAPGRTERLALVEDWLGSDILQRARGGLSRRQLADDDILDACAALWTANRILGGIAETLPTSPPFDAFQLPMQMVF